MAVCVVAISEKGRKCLGVTLLLLNLSIAMMGLIMVVTGIILAVIFSQQKDMLKDFVYRKYTHFIIFSGLALIVFHLLGAKVCSDYGNYQTRENVQGFMLIYLGLLLVAFVLLIAVSISCATAIKNLKQGFEKGFLDLMSSYDSDKEKKEQINRIQIVHKCCGSTGYKDWTETSWYSEEYIRPELKKVKGRGVPFTCCDPSYAGPCIHDSGGHPRPGYQKDNGKSFYPKGCSKAITFTVTWIMKKLALWLILPMWLELITLVLTKYLHTSALNAMQSGDGQGKGFGYLMEKCPCTACEFCEVDLQDMLKNRNRSSEE